MSFVPVLLLVAVLFLAAMVNLALPSRVQRITMRICLGIALVTMLPIYSYACSQLHDSLPVMVLRALLISAKAFIGVFEYDAVRVLPFFQNGWVQILFWVGHFCAYYVTASAAISTLGEMLLKRVRLWMAGHGRLILIYGANDHALSLGRSWADAKGVSVVYVDESTALQKTIESFGAILFSTSEALEAAPAFLKHIGILPARRNSLDVYAMNPDGAKNLIWSEKLRISLGKMGISPELTRLMVLNSSEDNVQ